MKITTIEVSGVASALEAMRLPYNKETKSTLSVYYNGGEVPYGDPTYHFEPAYYFDSTVSIGIFREDVKLFQTLMKRGDSHAKMQRGILAYLDITVGIGVWAEIETYRAGHERLFSASTMHTEGRGLSGLALKKVKQKISVERQIRKIDYFSYQCLRNIVKQRYNHRDPDWHAFIEHIKTLPLAAEFILFGLEDELKTHDKMWSDYQKELEADR